MSKQSDRNLLDADSCYTAVKSRDARFDGKFFTAVVTTGIYCRPICPAPTPHRTNVRFYGCAAAAEEAGFRPCLRCHPETAPGTPAWDGAASAVSRALRLIGEGVLDEGDVEGLARRVGLGDRHLRRLFQQHLGVSPVAVAQTRRIHFAKKLIDETPLSMTEVAFSAGFSSIRRFNDVFKKAYGRPPSSFRSLGRRGIVDKAPRLQLRLAYRPPFDWAAMLAFLDARTLPGIELVEGNVYRRTVSLGEARGIIEVQPEDGTSNLILSVPSHLSRWMLEIVARTRRLFDLEADPLTIAAHFTEDPLLAGLFDLRPGLRVPGVWDGFEIAVRAILGQQVSVSHARTLAGCLVDAFGESMGEGELVRLFPTADRLVDAPIEEIGLTQTRAQAIRALARGVQDGRIDLSGAAGLDVTVGRLKEVPGVGDWTAHYIAMRACGEPDAFPAGDLVLRRSAAGEAEHVPSAGELTKRAMVWRPWRAYAAVHLWAAATETRKEMKRNG